MEACPMLIDEVSVAVSHFLTIVNTMHQRCSSLLEALTASKSSDDNGCNQLRTDMLEFKYELQDGFSWMRLRSTTSSYIIVFMSSASGGKESVIAVSSISTAVEDLKHDEDTAILESRISQIKDIFPDYGNGFVAACLEVYNQMPEEVIQRILEDTLHEDLLSLDTSWQSFRLPSLLLLLAGLRRVKEHW